jgi:hypothetical protein
MMKNEEIIELAKQAGFFVGDSEAYSPSVQEDHELTPYLETFAKLVAEKEREWVELTDEEMHECLGDQRLTPIGMEWARKMEQKIKERNL